jgi:alkanesulfonate monooxygenase SsuD/methylene tetrahydromethanopterin reductase-like flavin-dependent oxidoreductase (luciferase family)
MKFSIFFEMQIADPTAAKEAQTFHDCVEQSVLADELGYHCVWEVEHHGLYEYSHSSAPEVFLAFVAARTRRIRLGHGVTLLPFRYNHPIRIAERIATLDILSGGRVNWGSGKSSSLVEQVAFESEIPKLHEQWLEAVEMIPRMWSSDVFEHKGKFFQVAPTQIVPKPVQKPHPPIIVGGGFPQGAKRALAYGNGWMPIGGRNLDALAVVSRFRQMVAETGRNPDSLPMSLFGASRDRELLKKYRDAGIERTIFLLPTAAQAPTLANLDAVAALIA